MVSGKLQYHWEMYFRSIKSVKELEGYRGLKDDAFPFDFARNVRDRTFAFFHWVGAIYYIFPVLLSDRT